MRRAILAALAVTAGAMVIGGGVAAAHKAKYKSIVEIGSYEFRGAFAGTVGSFDSKRCDRARKVSLWRINPGAMDGPFGTAKTNSAGEWRIEVLATPGTYYAVVKKKTLRRSRKHRHVCSYDRSGDFAVTPPGPATLSGG